MRISCVAKSNGCITSSTGCKRPAGADIGRDDIEAPEPQITL
jgi:hypothetical protein